MFRTLLVLTFVFSSWSVIPAQVFEYQVRHIHALRDCRGSLKIMDGGVEYKTAHAKDSRVWKFEEIRTLEVKSSTEISLVTYEDQKRWAGKDKVFKFVLLDKKATPELTAFLLDHVKRPMALAILPETNAKPVFEIPVKHLRVVVGTTGMLRIFPDRITYQTSREGDSCYWRWSDIERFSQPDRFRLQIVSYVPRVGGPTEAYNFQLMQDLPEGVYDYIWVRLHPSAYYPLPR